MCKMCGNGKNGCGCGSDKEKSMPPRPDINTPKGTQSPKHNEKKDPESENNPHKK